MRDAMHDLHRLGFVTDIQEAEPGKLVLTLGSAALVPGAALGYELEHLYQAYRSMIGPGIPVVLELWDATRKAGAYTSEGLLLPLR
jgi:hypothetical protein